MKLCCVILAAGLSSRFGGDKLAETVEGKSLLRRAAEVVPAEEFDTVFLVTDRPEGREIARELGFVHVPNGDPEAGVSRSIRLGLAGAEGMDGALFLAADQPLLRRETVKKLVCAFRRSPAQIVCAAHGGVRGNPSLFPARFFDELRALTGDRGGRAVIAAHPGAVLLVEAGAEELADVDTRTQLEQVRASCGAGQKKGSLPDQAGKEPEVCAGEWNDHTEIAISTPRR